LPQLKRSLVNFRAATIITPDFTGDGEVAAVPYALGFTLERDDPERDRWNQLKLDTAILAADEIEVPDLGGY
jgi:hypothetical protein